VAGGDRNGTLAEAKVALLLVSDAFLASEFVMNEEVPKLLAAAEAKGVRVLWVSLSPCLVEHTPIGEYQAVLPLDHYLDELDKPQQQRALKTIAERIREALVAPDPEPRLQPLGVIPRCEATPIRRYPSSGSGPWRSDPDYAECPAFLLLCGLCCCRVSGGTIRNDRN
jgi:hypothetical protein